MILLKIDYRIIKTNSNSNPNIEYQNVIFIVTLLFFLNGLISTGNHTNLLKQLNILKNGSKLTFQFQRVLGLYQSRLLRTNTLQK